MYKHCKLFIQSQLGLVNKEHLSLHAFYWKGKDIKFEVAFGNVEQVFKTTFLFTTGPRILFTKVT